MEKIQQEFEAWAKATSLKNFLFWHPSDKQYEVHAVQMAFEGWKASRSSLCVELPENCKGMALTVDEFHKQLDKAGVSYK
ncbi:MAG: hypothetical protein ACRDC4_16130 [Plesiomonas sp.]